MICRAGAANPRQKGKAMYRRGSRKQDIETFIKVHILHGEIKKAIDLCEKYGITSKRFGQLVKQVESIG